MQQLPPGSRVGSQRGAGWLQEPGSADLTAWVDFAALRQAVTESLSRVTAHGPVAQGHFCLANGMEQRLDELLQARPPSPHLPPHLVASPSYHD